MPVLFQQKPKFCIDSIYVMLFNAFITGTKELWIANLLLESGLTILINFFIVEFIMNMFS